MRQRGAGGQIPPEEAILTILFLAAEADGRFSPEERAEIEGFARQSTLLRQAMSRGDLAMFEQAALQRIMRNKSEALEEACAALPEEMTEPIFERAVDVCLADSYMGEHEKAWLMHVAALLDVPEPRARQIVEQALRKAQY